MSLAQRISNRLRRFSRACYWDLPNEKETVLLASSGRSGSTWIQEIIARSGGYRVMFEPFHSRKIARLSSWNYRQYIEASDTGDAYVNDADAILRGKVRHEWVDQDNAVRFPRRRLVKEIRGNLFLAWLKRRFPHLRIVFLTRHPFGVARSRLGLGWDSDLGLFFEQRDLMANHFANDRDFLESIASPFARQVAFWAMENIVPLRELTDDDAIAISYEDVKTDPLREIERIRGELGLPLSDLDLAEALKPSRTAWKKPHTVTLSDAERDESIEVLKRFDLDRLYGIDERKSPGFAHRNLFSEFPYSKQSKESPLS